MMQSLFKLKENGTTVKTELLAGASSFMAMAYIIIVNPSILADTGMPLPALMTATILSAAFATIVMAFAANLPFALAPGMGLNAFFAYTVCLGMGKSWQFALTAVFLEGLIFLLLTALNVREAIINAIPLTIKKAISVGIGLFIAVIGLNNAKVIEAGPALLKLGSIAGGGSASLALIGLIITAALLALRVRGALLIGIAATTLLGIPMGITQVAGLKIFSAPASLEPIFMKFIWQEIFSIDMAVVLFTFLFIDMFDTVGTLIGVAAKSKMLDAKGNVPRAKQAFFADALGTTVGACLGTSTVTVFVESAAGVSEGGKTGLTALTTAILFLCALFFSPLFLAVPAAATAPVLILVGFFMISPIAEINLSDYSEAVPAYLTFLMMPLSYSISDGLAIGLISFVLLKIACGKIKEIKPATWPVAAVFAVKFLM